MTQSTSPTPPPRASDAKDPLPVPRRVGIAGLGVSGLSAAQALLRGGALAQGDTLVLFDASTRVGGVLQHTRENGFLLEHGAQGVLSARASFARAVRDASLAGSLVAAGPRARARYLVLPSGVLFRVTPIPWKWVSAGVLRTRELIRALAEPFVPRARGGDVEGETLYSFFARRFGDAFARRVAVPLATGIWAGGARALLVARAFPILPRWESAHGSVIRGALRASLLRIFRKGTQEGPIALPPGLVTFENGMSDFSAGLLADVRARARAQHVVLEERLGWPISHIGRGETRVLAVSSGGLATNVDLDLASAFLNPAPHSSAETQLENELDALVVAFAPWSALGLTFDDPTASEAWSAILREVVTHGVAVVGIGGTVPANFEAPRGFGALAPDESDGLLGVLNVHDIAPHHVPLPTEGALPVLYRVLLGGDRSAALVSAGDQTLIARARTELERLGFVPRGFVPTFAHSVAWPRAIARLDSAHSQALSHLDKAARALPGLFFTGNYMEGVGVADCISRSEEVADALADWLRAAPKGQVT